MMIKKRPIKALTTRIFVEVGYFMYKLPPTSPNCIEALFSSKKKHAFFEKSQLFNVLHA